MIADAAASNERISRILTALEDVVLVGGDAEKTSIVPNLRVEDATPADLPAGYIIVENELGYFVPAVLVSGLTVADDDYVNLIYIKGTEPIAFQHGSASGGGVTGEIAIQDEGVPQGDATTLNFVGEAVTAAVALGTATITITGGGDTEILLWLGWGR